MGYITVVSWNFAEQIEVFLNETEEAAKQEVRNQLSNYNYGEDIAQVYEVVEGQKEPRLICTQDDIFPLED